MFNLDSHIDMRFIRYTGRYIIYVKINYLYISFKFIWYNHMYGAF